MPAGAATIKALVHLCRLLTQLHSSSFSFRSPRCRFYRYFCTIPGWYSSYRRLYWSLRWPMKCERDFCFSRNDKMSARSVDVWKKSLDCKYPGVTFQKTGLGMWPKFIRIVRPGCDIFISAEMSRVECVYLPFRMFFIPLRVISYARNIISAQAGVNLTFVMHVQCSMNAFIRPEYLKLLWGLFILLSVSLSLSFCNMSERQHPPLIWDAGQIRGPFIVYFTLELFWSRWRQGAASLPLFFIPSAACVFCMHCLWTMLCLNSALTTQDTGTLDGSTFITCFSQWFY